MTTKKLRLLYNRTVLYFQTEAEFLNYIVMFPGNRAVAYCADSKKTYLHNGGTSNTIADFDIVKMKTIKLNDSVMLTHILLIVLLFITNGFFSP